MAVVVNHHSGNNYTVDFDSTDLIFTTVTSSSDEVEDWIEDILYIHRRRLSHLIVGLDVEWRPNTLRYQNPVAVLQLCVGRRCLVFQIMHADCIPDSLSDFLTDSRFTFVGVGIHGDVEKIRDDYGLDVGDVQDLAEMAGEEMGRPELMRVGLGRLAWEVMGVSVYKPKRVTMSRWDHRTLSYDQVGYACVDAFLSFEIGRMLFAGEFD